MASTLERIPIILVGPTASGKSALGLALAIKINGVIINADSAQLYRGLEILTAQPTEHDKRLAPHKLYGILSPTELCSAITWAEMAKEEITAAQRSGKRPIIVGGTGFYIKTLLEGLPYIPPVPEEIREAALQQRKEMGPEAFLRALKLRDPILGEQLHSLDEQRVLRAWEVWETTGKPLSWWQQQPHSPLIPSAYVVSILPPRDILQQTISKRLSLMFEAGVVTEVKNLLSLQLGSKSSLAKVIGFREIRDYLEDKYSLDEARQRIFIATRQYAKRQVTWFRHQLKSDMIIPHLPDEIILQELLCKITNGC